MNNVRLTTSLTVGDGLVVVALVVSLVQRTLGGSLSVTGMNGLLIGVVAIVAGGLLGSFFAAQLSSSVAGLARFGAATLTLPILFGLWRPTLRKLQIVSWSFVVGATVNAVVGLLFVRTSGRAEGLSVHPNHLALGCLMAVGLGLGLGLSAGTGGKLALAVALPLLVLGTLLSGSRSGIVAEVLVIVFVAAFTHNRGLILTATAAMVVICVALGFGFVGRSGSSAVGRLLGGGQAAASDQQRSETVKAALQTIYRHPLTGGGFQNALNTHEIVLEIASTGGVLGVFGLGFVGWIALRPAWTRYRWGTVRSYSPGDMLLIGAMAAVVGFFANGIFGNELYDRYIWLVFTIAVALANQLRAERASNSQFPSPIGI
jgi:hypothetical protein